MPRDVASDLHYRRFAVHAATDGRHRAEIVYAAGHEAAAVAFLEGGSPAIEDDGSLTVVVHDCDSGREHCYRIDLDTGETGPCH
jgi:hypothetical protein